MKEPVSRRFPHSSDCRCQGMPRNHRTENFQFDPGHRSSLSLFGDLPKAIPITGWPLYHGAVPLPKS